MKRRTSLPLAPKETGLGLPTIMDRDVAAAHGVGYVHLAVFAIDIDRVYWLQPEAPELPFGWEVFLCEWYLLAQGPSIELLEAIATPLLEETPGEPPLGGQVVFAIYAAALRGALPASVLELFRPWRNPPQDLIDSLATLRARGADAAKELAEYCLSAPVTPQLAPPTQDALTRIARGELAPSAAVRGT
jgi:hypothetical protein